MLFYAKRIINKTQPKIQHHRPLTSASFLNVLKIRVIKKTKVLFMNSDSLKDINKEGKMILNKNNNKT